MLLAIDVGNTQTVLGLFQGRDLAWHWRMATLAERTPDELALLFGAIASDVPHMLPIITSMPRSRAARAVASASVRPPLLSNFTHTAW